MPPIPRWARQIGISVAPASARYRTPVRLAGRKGHRGEEPPFQHGQLWRIGSSVVEVWTSVAARRSHLAEWARGIDASTAEAPSWCEGWRVRDVLGHLVHLAEATQLRMARDVITRGPTPDRALARIAKDLGQHPVAELADRLQSAAMGRFHVLGSPAVVALGEVLVHGSDMMRAAGATDDVDPSIVVPVLQVYRRLGRVAFHAAPASKVTLAATDIQAVIGSGPEVRGRALDLLLLLANRRQVLADLSGQGLHSVRG